MLRLLVLTSLLLGLSTSLAQAQGANADCLSDKHSNNRVSGRVVYVSFKHPARDIRIWGYKLVLLNPRCGDYEIVADRKVDVLIDEIVLLPFGKRRLNDGRNRFFASNDEEAQWKQLDAYLRPRVGQLFVVTGETQDNLTIYYIAAPQIVINSLAPCEVTPKSKSIAAC